MPDRESRAPRDVLCTCGAMSPATARFCSSCGRSLASARRGSDEERRRVTAVFADLSGFTTLAGQVDAEGLLTVVDTVIAGIAGIVERYGGHVAKFVGDAVLALFGAPVAHEDDAARALSAASEMHAWLRDHKSTPGAPELALHIGVSTGTVVARSFEGGGRVQYDVVGESVIIAQRLEALAPNGETYVGELTRQLAAAAFDFDDLGPHAIKGRAAPVAVFRLRSRRASPVRTGRGMFGREVALRAVVEALQATAVRGGVVHLVGPAGSGKSRLVAEFRSHPAAADVSFIEIVGESYSQGAYQSFAPLFAEALAARYPGSRSTADRLRRLAADPMPPASVGYTSILAGDPVEGEPLAGRGARLVARELAAAATAWLTELGHGRIVVVAVENVQWLDPSSADLLRDMTSQDKLPGVLFCLLGRLPPKPTGADMAPVVIELRPLGPDQIERLIVDELALTPDERLTGFVQRRSEGNPLMARETVRHLRDEGLLDARHGHVRLVAGAESRDVPATLETLLSARIDSMTASAVQVAMTAAVIGIVVPVPLLASMCEKDVDFELHVEEMVSAGFVTRHAGGDLRFDNPIVRDVFYSRLTRRRRQALHARIADAVGTAVAPSETASALLAEHRFLAGDAAGALPWLRKIAVQASRVYAHDDAVIALVRAVESAHTLDPPQPELVSTLLCDLGDLRMELGEYDLADMSYREAQELDADARAFAGSGAALRRLGDYARARAELEAALDSARSGDIRPVWRELSAVLSVSGDLDGSLAAARNGLALGRDDDQAAAQLLLEIVRTETLLRHFDAATTHVADAIGIFEQSGDQTRLCTALRLLGSVQEGAGLPAEAEATLEQGLALAERAGLVEEIGGCSINLGLVKGALGDHQGAADCYARAAVTFERSGNRAGRAAAYGNRAYELFMLGDGAAARSLAAVALELAGDVGNHLTAADIHHTLGLIAESAADPDGAVDHAQAAIREFELADLPEAAQDSRDLAERNNGSAAVPGESVGVEHSYPAAPQRDHTG